MPLLQLMQRDVHFDCTLDRNLLTSVLPQLEKASGKWEKVSGFSSIQPSDWGVPALKLINSTHTSLQCKEIQKVYGGDD